MNGSTELDELDEIVREFLVESHENLDAVEQELVELERDPGAVERIATIFRAVHTIKGTCGFFGFEKLMRVAHMGENLLDSLRSGDLKLDGDRASALLAMVDAIRQMLGVMEETGMDGDDDFVALVDTLVALNSPDAPEAGAAAAAAEASDSTAAGTSDADTAHSGVGDEPAATSVNAASGHQDSPVAPPEAEAPIAPGAGPDIFARDDIDAVKKGPLTLITSKQPRPPHTAASAASAAADLASITPPPLKAPSKKTSSSSSSTSSSSASPRASHGVHQRDSTIRVDVSLLDKLMDLVGELVLARNQVLRHAGDLEDASLAVMSQRLDVITSELQENVMKTRMRQLSHVFDKMPRVVRDLAVTCGKRVNVEIEGREVELDRSLISAIKDPLTHLVRNSIDHGIEQPHVRERNGKPAVGTVTLRAAHEGGLVIIELSDDGGGIDANIIKNKAVEKGLLDPDEAMMMSDEDAIKLIFMAGFSTAEAITNVSGRGVGMDVVRTNIEEIGGTVEVESVIGQGSVFRIKIPLTLAIIPALIVRSYDQRYAIPQVSLIELVRVSTREGVGIELIQDTPVYRLRDQLLPLVFLSEILDAGEFPGIHGYLSSRSALNIIVVQAEGRPFGLVVDHIDDGVEIVVKPLADHLKQARLFVGATIMGDGCVALILDIMGLAQRANLANEGSTRSHNHRAHDLELEDENRRELLIFTNEDRSQVALPLTWVTRLERLPMEQLESVGDMQIAQYRGGLLPIVRASNVLMAGPGGFDGGFGDDFGEAANDGMGADDSASVLVLHQGERQVGLLVERIVDIVSTSQGLRRTGQRPGSLGTMVVNDVITEVLDVESVFMMVPQEDEYSGDVDMDLMFGEAV